MISNTDNSELSKFLSILNGSKDVGLVVAQDEAELDKFSEEIAQNGFNVTDTFSSLETQGKYCLQLKSALDKDTYDFLRQYPTGQIEIYNKELNSSKVYTPDYLNSVLIVLVLRNNIEGSGENSLNIMNVVGPVFKSN